MSDLIVLRFERDLRRKEYYDAVAAYVAAYAAAYDAYAAAYDADAAAFAAAAGIRR